MYPLLLIRYGELSLKGKNRRVFENILLENIRKNLESVEHGPLPRPLAAFIWPLTATGGNWPKGYSPCSVSSLSPPS